MLKKLFGAADNPPLQEVLTEKIRTDGGTQPRAGLDQDTVNAYYQAMENGDTFPPMTIFYDGEHYWLADGFHRLAAMKRSHPLGIYTRADIRQGTQRDAILYSVGANANHGLPRSNEDKRRAILRLLDDSEWSQWSDREIARHCKVSAPTVAKYRNDLTVKIYSENNNGAQPERTYTTKHGTVASMRTANIGSNHQQPEPKPAPVMPEFNPNDPVWAVVEPTQEEANPAPPPTRPEYAPIHRLEALIREWLKLRTGGGDRTARRDITQKIKAADREEIKTVSTWLTERTDFRVSDFKQAVNNIHEQLRQQIEMESRATELEPVKFVLKSAAPAPEPAPAAPEPEPATNGNGDSDEWYTPAWLIDLARQVLGEIDLDPASSHEAQTVVKARRYWTKDQDGSRQAASAFHINWIVNNGPAWEPIRVWLNPPYSRYLLGKFVDKFLEQFAKTYIGAGLVLTNSVTDTNAWHKLAGHCTCMLFFHGRISFWGPNNIEGNGRNGQTIFYFGPDHQKFVEVFGSLGVMAWPKSIQQ
jgi:hypothetical protein